MSKRKAPPATWKEASDRLDERSRADGTIEWSDLSPIDVAKKFFNAGLRRGRYECQNDPKGKR